MESEDHVIGPVGFVDEVIEVRGVERIFVDEDRVLVARPDVAQRENLFRRAVEPVDLAHRDAVVVEDFAEGLSLADFARFETVGVGVDAVDDVALGLRIRGSAAAGSGRQGQQSREVYSECFHTCRQR